MFRDVLAHLSAISLLARLCFACVDYLKHLLTHAHQFFCPRVYAALGGKHKLETERSPSAWLGIGFGLGKLAFLSGSVVPHRSP